MKIESNKRAIDALREVRKRERLIAKMKDDSFREQWNFILDPSRLKSARTTRRAGKSMAASLCYLKQGIESPGCSMLYIGLTNDSAWRILWKDCLKKLGKKYDIALKGRKSEGSVTLEDYGSIIYFLGIDDNEEEMAKAYGQKYKLCVVDEAALYKQDIRTFVYDCLFPATADYEGTVCLTGMPCNNTKSFFFDVTNDREPGWSNHRWSVLDNPYMAEKMAKQIEFLKKNNPGIENTPTFKQQYLGEWAVSDDSRMYHFDDKKNMFDLLPEDTNWHYVMGVDLGWDDPTAFVILAYRDYDPTLYAIEAYMRSSMTLTEVADRIKHYSRYYRFDNIIIDNSAKQGVEELKQRHNLSLTPADKAGKADFIHLCNDDLKHGRVKIRSVYCEPLIAEWQTLIWDEKALARGKYTEASRAKNHCSDAFLYAWRHCYNWVDRGVEVDPYKSAEQITDAFWQREIERATKDPEGWGGLEKEYGYTD